MSRFTRLPFPLFFIIVLFEERALAQPSEQMVPPSQGQDALLAQMTQPFYAEPIWAVALFALVCLVSVGLAGRLYLKRRRGIPSAGPQQGEQLHLTQDLPNDAHKILQATFEAIQDPVLIIDENLHIVASNWKNMEHVPDHVRQCCPSCHLSISHSREQCPSCPVEEIFKTGESRIFEHVNAEDGRTFEIRINPIKDEHGKVTLALEHIRDITSSIKAQDALNRSEERLQKVIDHAPLIIWSINPEGILTLHQGRGLINLGQTPGANEGKSLFEAYADNPQVCEMASRALRGEHVEEILEVGSTLLDVRYAPIFNTQGKVVESIGVAFDITARKKADRDTRRADFILNSHVENSPLAVIEWDHEFRVVRWSGRANQIFGWTADEVLGKTPDEIGFVSPEDQDDVAAVMEELLEGRAPHNKSQNRNITRAGRVIHCEWYNSVHFDENGKTYSVLSLAQDVSEAVESQTALAAAKENLEKTVVSRTFELERAMRDMALEKGRTEIILASVADGLVVTDNDNRILNLNRAAEAILGLSQEKTRGKRLEEAIQDRTLCDKLSSNIRKANNFDSYQFEVEFNDPGKGATTIQARTAVIRDDGEQSGVVISLRDVTADKEVDRMKSEFISTAAHELRTPLTTIQGFSELLLSREGLEAAIQTRYLKYINKQACALTNIIADLLDISRIESGKGFSFDKKTFDLCDAVAAKIEAFDEASPNHEFFFSPPERTCEIVADRGKFEQLLENLFSNAVKYSPEGGPIEVNLNSTNNAFDLSISDQGLGMTIEQVNRIFEKFYRGHSVNGSIPGTGLGMSIVKHIVEGHGGTVKIDSEQGVGTSVRIIIPIDGVGLTFRHTSYEATGHPVNEPKES